jgi:hypothetical protein
MTEERLAKIEARANAIHAEMAHTRTRCDHCDMVNPPVDGRGRHDRCPDADEWPTKVGRDETKIEGVAGLREIAGHMTDLVAEVRRLTAALAALRDGTNDAHALANAIIARLRAEHTAALEIARREGAEAMRERCAVLAEEHAIDANDAAFPFIMRVARDARALPLDAPGGES